MFPPDILNEARGFSSGALLIAAILGLALWLFGWRAHRFWIVLGVTVSAGLYGLVAGPEYGSQPLVAGLLLAIATGTLALALVRVVIFAAGGLLTWMVVHALTPSWHEPLVCFFVGGLIAILLFRFWTMVLTSWAGSLLLLYAGLCFGERLGKLNPLTLADKQAAALNLLCLGMTFVGWLVQYAADRRRNRKIEKPAEPKSEDEDDEEAEKEKDKRDRRDKDKDRGKDRHEGKKSASKKAGWRFWGGSVDKKAG